MPTSPAPETRLLRLIRRGLALVLVVGMLGTGSELVLIDHDETTKELIPIVGLSVAAAALLAHLLLGARTTRRLLQLAMLGLLVVGVLGAVFHYESNAEFQAEIDPELEGWQLVLASLKATSPPSLAPGVFVQLGLVGLIFAHRNERKPQDKETT